METTVRKNVNGTNGVSLRVPEMEIGSKRGGRATRKKKDEDATTALPTPRMIMIPGIAKAVIRVSCMGLSPLIIKAWSKEARREMLDKQQGKPVPKKLKDPEREFESCRYRNRKGQDYIPGHILKKCLTSVAELVGVKKSLLAKIIFVLDEEIIIKGPPPRMREDMVRNRGRFGSVADIRFRPCFDKWGFECDVEFHTGFLTPEAVLNLFRYAGDASGLGEWRVQKEGQYGRFEPTSFEHVRRGVR